MAFCVSGALRVSVDGASGGAGGGHFLLFDFYKLRKADVPVYDDRMADLKDGFPARVYRCAPRASRSADSHYTDFRDIAVFPCDPRGKRVYPGCHEIKKSAWRRKSGSLCCAAYDVGGQYGGRACGCGSDEGHRKSGKKDEYRQITDRSDGLHLHFGGSGIFGGSACCLRGGNV